MTTFTVFALASLANACGAGVVPPVVRVLSRTNPASPLAHQAQANEPTPSRTRRRQPLRAAPVHIRKTPLRVRLPPIMQH